MLASLSLDGFALHNNANGTRMLTGVSGLVGFPQPRGDARDRPEGDGAIEPVDVFLGAKIITVEGTVWEDPGISTAYANWRALQAVFFGSVRAQKTLQWNQIVGGLPLQHSVRCISAVAHEVAAQRYYKRFDYQAMLRAADPLAYDQTQKSAGPAASSVNALNGGDLDTWPSIEILGPITAPTITDVTAGRILQFTTVIPAGNTMIVDCNPATRGANLNGASKLGDLVYTASDFFNLPAGGATHNITLAGSGTTAATRVTVKWRDAYTG